MEIAILILTSIIVLLQLFIIIKGKTKSSLSIKEFEDTLKDNNDIIDEKLKNHNALLEEKNKNLFEKLDLRFSNVEKYLESIINSVNDKLDLLNKNNSEFFNKLTKDNNEANEKIKDKLSIELKEFTKDTQEMLSQIKDSLDKQLNQIRDDNTSKLEKINEAVNEKLEKTLEGKLKQSFESVVEQIGGVNKAIGEIKGLANDVGSLKSVLTNVKTKGIVGEVILKNIIQDILTTKQYEENVITKEKSNERVEFAIKMPNSDNGFIYLPIDSKFPLESYHRIQEGIDKADKTLIENARKELRNSIKKYAKDISNKYIDVPNTTDFAIMFLPLEGLYVEALNLGLFEEVQKEYKINLAGPTTLTAILNALQMGFKTLLIQKKSSDVFKLLGAVKTEFEKFAETLDKTQKKVNEASNELDKLVGTRTRMIKSKLNNIDGLDEIESKELIEE